MARPLINQQYDSVATYIDGLRVKIADSYKPPKIERPCAYDAAIPEISKYCYDFSLDRTVQNRMKQWQEERMSCLDNRRKRLEEKKKQESTLSPSIENVDQSLSMNLGPNSKTNILIPQQLFSPSSNSQNHIKINGLDYSDFDNDTSSPFDNMELKTINEMEELAQVLQPTNTQWSESRIENTLENVALNRNSDHDKCIEQKQKVISSILNELKLELDKINQKNSEETRNGNESSGDSSINSKSDQQKRSMTSFSKEDKKFVKYLRDMGFPLPRITKAINDLKGQDKKKIVEYLLAIQSMEDMGISEEEAVKSLALTQYDRHKAQVYYESLCTLRDLGFPEDKASSALLKCNIDRDSALDLLIS